MEEEEEQEVWSWGAGAEGQLGTGSEKDELLPQLVSSLSSVFVSALSCGGAHVIALTSGGKVFSWGRGSSGQLGQGDFLNRCLKPPLSPPSNLFPLPLYPLAGTTLVLYPVPDVSSLVEMDLLVNLGMTACGMRHSIVVCKGESKFSVYGFGSCKRGQIGSTSSHTKSAGLPQHIPEMEGIDIVGLYANGDHSAALSADGRLYSWGRGVSGASDAYSPQLLPSSPRIKQASLGWNHALALTDDGEVLMLGGKQHGLLNDSSWGSMANEQSGIDWEKVRGLDGAKVIQIAAGSEHSALVNEDGAMMTWGWGEHGQLGLGDTSDQILPQAVNPGDGLPFVGNGTSVYCGSGFTFVIGKHQRPSTIWHGNMWISIGGRSLFIAIELWKRWSMLPCMVDSKGVFVSCKCVQIERDLEEFMRVSFFEKRKNLLFCVDYLLLA